MKRTMFFSAIFGTFALAGVASADNGQQNSKQSPMIGIDVQDFEQDDDDNDRPKRRKFRKFGGIVQIIDHFKDDEKEEQKPPVVPIDPGMGNGQPTAPPAPPVPTRPGYVWVGDHWERERAPQPVVVQPVARPGFVWVGDHWERERAPQSQDYFWNGTRWELKPANTVTPTVVSQPSMVGPVVRDHRTPAPYVVSGNQGGVVIRDHRTPQMNISQAPGGVTVTSTPRPPRPPRRPSSSAPITSEDGLVDAIGDGLSEVGDALGDALGSAGNAVGIGYGSVTPIGPAKPVYKAPPGATVRDHRN